MSELPGRSWGNYARATQQVVHVSDRNSGLPSWPESVFALPYGNGRSYGDSCLNDHGVLLCARALDRFIAFNATTGVLECEAGVLLDEILDLCVPQGWFPWVTPGTRFVSMGGAVANDVHGKNQISAGSMGDCVLGLELLRSDRERLWCDLDQNPELFAATIGGLGLTGLITRVRLQLRRIQGPWMSTETLRFGSLEEFFALSAETSTEYSVAWVDCLARGTGLGRGIFSRANHAPAHPERRPRPPVRTLSVPFTPPFSLINRFSLRAFNEAYFHRSPRRPTQSIVHYQPFFYPLDSIGRWNRIYGRRGFLQHQCVVPPPSAPEVVTELLRTISASGQGSFLAVLKQFGNRPSPGLLSFARPGVTLALDFPALGDPTLRLLDRLDQIVIEAGGAIYPAKDARMSPQAFRASFPRLDEFVPFVDPRFSSGLWRRVMENP